MPRYEPIDTGLPIKASLSDLAAFNYATNSVRADFIIPDDPGKLLQVEFKADSIVRILDEMPLSTEEDGPWEGLIPDHFAYRVTGAAFFEIQSQAWKEAGQGVAHYRFITGWACLDVISFSPPTFSLAVQTADD